MIWNSEPGTRNWSRMGCATKVVWLYSGKCPCGTRRRQVAKTDQKPRKELQMQEAHVDIFYRSWKPFAAVAALAGMVFAGAVQIAHAQTAPAKNWKDRAEDDMYVEVGKDIGANNFAKALTDLDAWKSKYPQTDYANQRTVLYAQAYNGA